MCIRDRPNAGLDRRRRWRLRSVRMCERERPVESAQSPGDFRRPLRDHLLSRRRHHRLPRASATCWQPPIMTTVAIVEDNAVMRKTFRQWINASPDYHCVLACATAGDALAEIPKLKPDVVLMDIHL